jgi:pimeloyl-ACP methyl ester carboxylesterase
LIAGCVDRSRNLDQYSETRRWEKVRFFTDGFVLTGMVRTGAAKSDTLTVYIEGDGLAWLGPSEVSSDPTPRDPVAMELAFKHPPGAVTYLARPCQYTTPGSYGRCHPRYWTVAIFAPEIIAAMNSAVEQAKQRAGARHLVLIGYSGGGTAAALIAARRRDVVRLVTIAANLDHESWTRSEKLTPLYESLNPVNDVAALQGIEQIHFVGGEDTVVPPLAVYAYRDRFPANRRPTVRLIRRFDHRCCWIDAWPGLLQGRLPR